MEPDGSDDRCCDVCGRDAAECAGRAEGKRLWNDIKRDASVYAAALELLKEVLEQF